MNPLLLALVNAGVISLADAERIERQLSPDAARDYAEGLITQSFQRGLTAQQRRLLDVMDDTEGNPTERQLSRLWDGEDELLWASVGDDLRSIAIDRAVSASIALGDDSMWQLVNEEVLTWLDDYYVNPDAGNFGSIPNLNETSKNQFAQAFRDWQRGELATAGYNEGLPTLIRSLEPIFGATRAEAIATTEYTRIASQSELAAGNANPDIEGWIYSTANDSRVSELCRSGEGAIMLKGETVFSDGKGPPPRHVRCRSSISAISGPALQALRADGLVRERENA